MYTYKFYFNLDGKTYGPYTAAQIRDLQLSDEILVTEESMGGQWHPAAKFDFDDMVRKEAGPSADAASKTVGGKTINPDGTVTNPNGWKPATGPVPPSPYGNSGQTPPPPAAENSSYIGWKILAFLIPLVGWILYFCWRKENPEKASAVCTWAWIGFGVNLFITLLT